MAILNQYELEKFCQITAARAGLKVEWKQGATPMTDGTRIILPSVTASTTEDQASKVMSYVIHEVSHCLYTDFDVINENGIDPSKSFLGALHNLCDDVSIDAKNSAVYRGDREIRNKEVAEVVNDLAKQFEEMPQEMLDKDEIQKVLSSLTWSVDATSETFPDCFGLDEKLKKFLTSKGKAWHDKLVAGNYKKAIHDTVAIDDNNKRTKSVYSLAKRIFEEVYELDADKEEAENKARAQSAAGSGGENGKENAAGKGKGSGKGEPAEGRGEAGKKRGEPDPDGKFEEFDYSQFGLDEAPPVPHAMRKEGSRVSYRNYTPDKGARSYAPTPHKDTIVVDYIANKSNYSHISVSQDERTGYRTEQYAQAGNVSDGFAQKVRRILQIRAKGRVQYGTKTGALHAGNLFRLRVDGASQEYRQRVFKKRIVSDVLDSAVSVLVDTSGSMSGMKYACAITAAVHLSDTIGNTLHIPTEIIGFTEVEYRNTMFVHRTFDKKLLSKEALTKSLMKASYWMNQNCDGDSVLFAASRLLQRKEKRKLLIVLSDGSPASSKPGDVMGYTINIVKQLDSMPALDIVGIGIQDDNVTRIYKQHHVINEAHEIENALLSIIERKLI